MNNIYIILKNAINRYVWGKHIGPFHEGQILYHKLIPVGYCVYLKMSINGIAYVTDHKGQFSWQEPIEYLSETPNYNI